MTRDEVKTLFKRIKSNYPTFVADEFKLTEWSKELKDYDEAEVHEKLEQHMRSEQYGGQEPKVYFLTKYLIKKSEKDRKNNYVVRCQICGKSVSINDYDNHYERCLDIEYLDKNNKKYFSKSVDKEKLQNMDQDEFEVKFDKFCEYILENTKDEEEKENLMRYFLEAREI